MNVKERKIERLKAAIEDAKRFIAKANAAVSAFEKCEEPNHNSKSFASAKRASMDLSRSLADVRCNPYTPI